MTEKQSTSNFLKPPINYLRSPYRIDFADGIIAFRSEVSLGQAPNKTVAVLLLGLLHLKGEWRSRGWLAENLYPAKGPSESKVALRQSLHRLKSWLGTGAVEINRDFIRVESSKWDLTALTNPDRILLGLQSLIGIDHPWLDLIDRELEPQRVQGLHPSIETWVQAVRSVSKLDRDTGRSILLGGNAFEEMLPFDLLIELLRDTKPQDRRDPFYAEHGVTRARIQFQNLDAIASIATLRKLHAITKRDKAKRIGEVIAANIAFNSVEMGLFTQAREWMPEEISRETGGLISHNARAAFAWNLDRKNEAMEIYRTGIAKVKSADRLLQLHYWRNYSVLAAEAGNFMVSEFAQEKCNELIKPEIDEYSTLTLTLAEAGREALARNFEGALEKLDQSSKKGHSKGWHLSALYAEEAQAELLARSGNHQAARNLWHKCESLRRSHQMRLTPRLLARRRLILG